jgi:beta-glucosidase
MRSLAAFRRVHLAAGESRNVELELDARAMSAVDATGRRAVLAGTYHLDIGPTQPAENRSGVSTQFTVSGSAVLAP